MKLRTNLFMLVLGAIAPLLVVAAIGGAAIVQHERETVQREATGRTRSVMTAVDTKLAASITTALALARSKSLAADDLRAFHEESRQVLASQPDWLNVGLATVAQNQVMDAVLPYGKPAPFSGHDDAFDLAIQTRQPAIGNVRPGSAISEPTIRIRVPVNQNGSVRYVLSVPLKPSSFGEILRAQQIPDGRVIALVDRDRKIIARIPDVPAGGSVSESFKAAIQRGPEGWFAGRTLEGTATYTPYVTSEVSGWVLGIAVPASVIEAGARRASFIAGAGVLIALAIAAGLAWLVGRRIAGPISDMAAASGGFGRNLEIRAPGVGRIDEIVRLDGALREASRAAAERQLRLEEQAQLLTQRTAEAETLMEVMPLPVFKAEDAQCRRVSANRAGYRLLGMQPGHNVSKSAAPEEIPGNFRICRDGREVPVAELPLRYASTHGVEVQAEELEFRFEDGSMKVGYVYAAPLFDGQGKTRGAVCAILDITERKQIEQQMKEADRRKDEFLATLAHELRNPLAPIRNAVHILRGTGHSDSELQWSRDVIDRQVRHMARLLDDLLDLSRLTHAKLELRKERCTLAAVMESALETSQPCIEDGRHELTVVTPPAPVYLEADPVRLSQVLSNLLNNAARYTPAGGQIRLTAERHRYQLTVTVRDNGIGIAPEMLPCVFDMFSQGPSGVAPARGGLGIGLALTRGLVESHGGTVEARSEGRGKGSEFVVHLPIVVDSATQGPLGAAEIGKDAGDSRRRILIVDDLKESALSLAAVLRGMGYEVHTASDGEEAVAAAARLYPDVVLLDIGMPRMGGYDACRHIRDLPQGKQMLVIAVTGWGQEKDRLRSEEAGFDHHLVKPVDPAELNALLRKLG